MDNEKYHVLVLDADTTSANEVVGWSGSHGHTAHSASTYLEFDALLTERVALIILDLKLPDVDGIEVLRLLAAQGYKGGILICSDIERRYIRAAERIGLDQQLDMLHGVQKPISREMLCGHLDRFGQSTLGKSKENESSVKFREQELQDALETKQINFVFQPIVELDGGRCTAIEALARWQHPKYGLLTAGQFMHAATENVHHQLFELLLTDALRDFAVWHKAGAKFHLNVNLSVVTLQMQDLPGYIDQFVALQGLPAEAINFEITEERMSDDYIVAMENLIRLGLNGYNVSIDDFGTEYSSLQRLSRLPINTLKLDRRIVINAMTDTDALAIMESCISLGHKMNLWVIAEGIESAAQLEMARELGCNAVQGFHVARPVPRTELLAAVGIAEERTLNQILENTGVIKRVSL